LQQTTSDDKEDNEPVTLLPDRPVVVWISRASTYSETYASVMRRLAWRATQSVFQKKQVDCACSNLFRYLLLHVKVS